tara:strand:+ start:156 stop:527 length:372 start_codon:yes stop_codon:yes gene_type:complete
MNARVIITIKPKKTSYFNIFLLKKIGSKNAENNDDVDRQITAIETFETLILSKKNSQCNATTNPALINGKIFFGLICLILFFINKKINNKINAISILYQTKCVDSRVISLPSIPVNPKTKTIK